VSPGTRTVSPGNISGKHGNDTLHFAANLKAWLSYHFDARRSVVQEKNPDSKIIAARIFK
jgi:hypothetical protein